jgi:hypothetical protein
MPPPSDNQGRSRVGLLTERIRTGARRAFGGEEGADAVTRALEAVDASGQAVPNRYQIREGDDGRFVSCNEASNIALRVERGLSVSAAAARKQARGTIFLDGAAQGEPFVDAGRGVINLDHHEGCVRAFTLATCEQAMVLVLKGLDLEGEQWTVWINEPDLDAVLAAWLLLNHRRLAGDRASLRQRVMPLVRLQGVIDAHGFELSGLAALPAELHERTLATINRLRSDELALREAGSWGEVDPLVYTAKLLREIDRTVYAASDFEGLSPLEELGRVRISPRRFAIACRAEAGIYEIEERLREIYGERLGVVILQKDPGTYTLRQADPFLPSGLERLYDRLNLVDTAVRGEQRWGGSADIGGSPRGPGTALTVDEVLDVCAWVYNPPSGGRRLAVLAAALAVAAAVVLLAAAAAGGLSPPRLPGLLLGEEGTVDPTGAAVLAVVALALTRLGGRLRRGHFGWRWPRRFGFLALLPVAATAVAAGGGFLVWSSAPASWAAAAGPLVAAVGFELLLRGVLHGMLVTVFPIMLTTGRRFVSTPNGVAALASALIVPACLLPPSWISIPGGPASATALAALAALVLGLLCGSARERWGSVWAAVVLHLGAVVVVLAALALR